MKAFYLAALITVTTSVSAAERVFVTVELNRNGEVVDSISALIENGSVFPFNTLRAIAYTESVTRSKPKQGTLEVGTAGAITPTITTDGKIGVKYTVSHVHLVQMEEKNVGGSVLQLPRTEQPKASGFYNAQSGQKVEIKTKVLEVNYVTTITATLR